MPPATMEANLTTNDATTTPPYTDDDFNEVATIFGEREAAYRLLRESRARGNQFVDGDLEAEADKLGYLEIERNKHSQVCSDASLLCDTHQRTREAKAKLPALVARVEELRRQIWDNPPLNRAEKIRQEQLLSDAVRERDEQREISVEGNRYAYLVEQCIDPRVFAELHKASDDLQKARDRHDDIKRELRPEIRVESTAVVAGDVSYTGKRNVPLDAKHWEGVAKYADRSTPAGEKEYQRAERELLRLKKAERQLAENGLAIDQLQELVAELERRPLRPAFFKM